MLSDANYAIYTFEDSPSGQPGKWDLHATSQNKDSAILHAKMLALQPRFIKIQVEKLQDISNASHRTSKTICTFKKGGNKKGIYWFFSALGVVALGYLTTTMLF